MVNILQSVSFINNLPAFGDVVNIDIFVTGQSEEKKKISDLKLASFQYKFIFYLQYFVVSLQAALILHTPRIAKT